MAKTSAHDKVLFITMSLLQCVRFTLQDYHKEETDRLNCKPILAAEAIRFNLFFVVFYFAKSLYRLSRIMFTLI